MGDPLGSPRPAPIFGCFFFLKSIDLSRFICYKRRVRHDQDEENHPNQAFGPCSVEMTKILLRMPPGPGNHFRDAFLQQHKHKTPRQHGAMKVVELPFVTHA